MTDATLLVHSSDFPSFLGGGNLVYVDAGARGGLDEAWQRIPEQALRVLAFEPDPEECAALAAKAQPNLRFIPKGLWSGASRQTVHLAETRSTSSIHPPNFSYIEQFEDRHWRPRKTEQTCDVDCVALDKVLAETGWQADFLKLDTQGAEYEILRGAKDALSSTVFGALVETWTAEVHAGQHLAGEIMMLMAEHKFELLDLNIAAAWHRHGAAERGLTGRRQIVGMDLLFFRHPKHWPEAAVSAARVIKAAAVLELYNYPDVAADCLDWYARRDTAFRQTADRLAERISAVAAAAAAVSPARGWFRRRKPAAMPVYAKLH